MRLPPLGGRWAGSWAALGLLVVGPLSFHGPTAGAAPAVRYGGTAVLSVWGPAMPADPADMTDWAHRHVAALQYESLYRCGPRGALEPVLAAGPPTLKGNTLIVPLHRSVARHDGANLTAKDVASALLRLRRGARPGAYVMTPVRPDEAAVRDKDDAIHIDLRRPYLEAARLLCAPHARIAVRARGRYVGTGPYRPAREGSIRKLVPFAPHRDGRPYLDEVDLRILRDKASAARSATRRGAALLLGAPDVGTKPLPGGTSHAEELVLVVLGRGLPRATLTPLLNASLDPQRARLAQKWRSVRAQPARCLVTETCALGGTASRSHEPRRVPLLVSSTVRWRPSFTARVQVALAPLGLMAPITTREPAALRTAPDRPRASAWLTSIVLPPRRDRYDQLHALFAIGAALGRPDVLAEAEWTAVLEDRATVEDLERRVVERLGLVPLVRAPVVDIERTNLRGLRRTADGTLRLDNAHFDGRAS